MRLEHRGVTLETIRVPRWADFAVPGALAGASVLAVVWALMTWL